MKGIVIAITPAVKANNACPVGKISVPGKTIFDWYPKIPVANPTQVISIPMIVIPEKISAKKPIMRPISRKNEETPLPTDSAPRETYDLAFVNSVLNSSS